MRFLVAAILALAWIGGPATAGEFRLVLMDEQGAPVPGGVVELIPAAGVVPGSRRNIEIDQRREVFVPELTVVPVGSWVAFRNSDSTRHHIFSFSAAKRINFSLESGDASTMIQLDRPGVVAVGCNIHDHMIAHLYVAESELVALTGDDGVARFGSLPDGAYVARVWHDRLRPGTRLEDVAFAVEGGAASAAPEIRAPLLPPRPVHRPARTY